MQSSCGEIRTTLLIELMCISRKLAEPNILINRT